MLVAPTYKKKVNYQNYSKFFENYDYVLYGIYDIERGSNLDPFSNLMLFLRNQILYEVNKFTFFLFIKIEKKSFSWNYSL